MIIDRIKKMYKETGGFAFSLLIDLIRDYNGDWRKELNDLRLQGIIRKRVGARGVLIEYMPIEKDNTE